MTPSIAGPAIILQADSTTLILPGSSARADLAGNLLIAIGGSHE
jgi:N-methylhydantoinase A/oxoprolinase/acetone carboxylase beta subunit